MRQRIPVRFWLVPIFAALLLAGACSDDTSTTAPTGSSAQPLTSAYWPLDEGTTWTYVRIEEGIYSPDPNISYFNDSLPSAHRKLELSGTATVNGLSARILSDLLTRRADGGGEVYTDSEIYIRENGSRLEVLGEAPVDTVAGNANFIYADVLSTLLSYSWIEFGTLHWETELADYSAEAIPEFIFVVPPDDDELPVDMGAARLGKILLQWATGFDYERTVYPTDGDINITTLPVDQFTSDVDNDLYPDGIGAVRLIGDVIAETDFAYADLGARADSLFPEASYPGLKEVVYRNCRLVRLALEVDLFRTNQRNPNAGPGQAAINYPFLEVDSYTERARRDIGFLLLAPGVGPVVITTAIDQDKDIKAGGADEPMTLFQPDRMMIDYLVDSSLLP